jgi:O-6-methylguanine DNA methyltransferase
MESALLEVGIPTPDGLFVARYSNRGLCGLEFPGRHFGKKFGAVPRGPASRWQGMTQRALRRALAGQKPGRLPPLDLSAGTPFQQQVWRRLATIPAGKSLSYGELAKSIGRPNAVRAVGGACGANPIPVLVPCHRVLAANGRLGGFSGALRWKRLLLLRERVSQP